MLVPLLLVKYRLRFPAQLRTTGIKNPDVRVAHQTVGQQAHSNEGKDPAV